MKTISAILFCLALTACARPQPGPDKTLGGAVLGAGWGAGAGAVIGNQVSYAGEGAAVGAGFGLVQGALTGAGFDIQEGQALKIERDLQALQLQNKVNERQIARLQATLDAARPRSANAGIHAIYFDVDASNLRAGSIAELEILADAYKRDPGVRRVAIVGHADDGGTPEYNTKLAEARARAVSAILAARGVALDQIVITSHGSERPIASNTSPDGRGMNRRVEVYVENRG